MNSFFDGEGGGEETYPGSPPPSYGTTTMPTSPPPDVNQGEDDSSSTLDVLCDTCRVSEEETMVYLVWPAHSIFVLIICMRVCVFI